MKRFLYIAIFLLLSCSFFYPRKKAPLFNEQSIFQDPYLSIKQQISNDLEKKGIVFNEYNQSLLVNRMLAIHLLENGKYEDYALIAMQQGPQDYLSWNSFCQLQQHYCELTAQISPIVLSDFLKKTVVILMLEDKSIQDKYIEELSDLEKCLLSTILSFQDLEKISSLDEGIMAFQHYQDAVLCDCYFDHINFYFLAGVLQNTCSKDKNYFYPFIEYTESLHAAFERAKKTSVLLKKHQYEEVYQQYIEEHAKCLHLDKDIPFHNVVTKLSIMMHFFDKQQAFIIADALLCLSKEDLNIILDIFNKDQSVADLKHFPLFLRKLLQTQMIGIRKSDRILTTLKIALPILIDAYKQQQSFSHNNHLLSKMEFIEMVKIVDNDPDALLKYHTDIDGNGVICLQK